MKLVDAAQGVAVCEHHLALAAAWLGVQHLVQAVEGVPVRVPDGTGRAPHTRALALRGTTRTVPCTPLRARARAAAAAAAAPLAAARAVCRIALGLLINEYIMNI